MRPVHSSKLIDLLELKNSYISGDELWASCPCPENHRHGDKKPSWSINLNTLRHHCFSCGFSGDAAGLVMRQRSCSRSQALRLLYGDLSFSEIQQLMAG
ncbi:MAG: CHC2 zinc finger domain-containing protein, partial [Eggerthella lenta]